MQDSWTVQYLKEKNEERERLIEESVQRILKKPCPQCSGILDRDGKTKFKCRGCSGRFRMKNVPKKPVDMSDKSNWRATCEDCGKKAPFYESPGGRMAYICKCGWILEV